MDKLKWRRIAATTLTESIVALVVITTVSGIALMLFVRTLTSGFSVQHINAGAVLERNITAVQQNLLFAGDDYRDGDFLVKKEILPFPGNEKLLRVKVSVLTPEGKLIRNQSILVLANEKN